MSPFEESFKTTLSLLRFFKSFQPLINKGTSIPYLTEIELIITKNNKVRKIVRMYIPTIETEKESDISLVYESGKSRYYEPYQQAYVLVDMDAYRQSPHLLTASKAVRKILEKCTYIRMHEKKICFNFAKNSDKKKWYALIEKWSEKLNLHFIIDTPGGGSKNLFATLADVAEIFFEQERKQERKGDILEDFIKIYKDKIRIDILVLFDYAKLYEIYKAFEKNIEECIHRGRDREDCERECAEIKNFIEGIYEQNDDLREFINDLVETAREFRNIIILLNPYPMGIIKRRTSKYDELPAYRSQNLSKMINHLKKTKIFELTKARLNDALKSLSSKVGANVCHYLLGILLFFVFQVLLDDKFKRKFMILVRKIETEPSMVSIKERHWVFKKKTVIPRDSTVFALNQILFEKTPQIPIKLPTIGDISVGWCPIFVPFSTIDDLFKIHQIEGGKIIKRFQKILFGQQEKKDFELERLLASEFSIDELIAMCTLIFEPLSLLEKIGLNIRQIMYQESEKLKTYNRLIFGTD